LLFLVKTRIIFVGNVLNVVFTLPTGDLRDTENGFGRRGNKIGHYPCDDPVDCITHRDWPGVLGMEGNIFGNKKLNNVIEVLGRGETDAKVVENHFNNRSKLRGEGTNESKRNPVNAGAGVTRPLNPVQNEIKKGGGRAEMKGDGVDVIHSIINKILVAGLAGPFQPNTQ
jgi:hypothetical protein